MLVKTNKKHIWIYICMVNYYHDTFVWGTSDINKCKCKWITLSNVLNFWLLDMLYMLDEVFALRNTLSETDESALYYISGYITKKENIMLNNKDMDKLCRNWIPLFQIYNIVISWELNTPTTRIVWIVLCFVLSLQECRKILLKTFTSCFQWNLWKFTGW